MLIEKGADINAKDKKGRSVLDLAKQEAAYWGWLNPEEEEVVQLLRKHGAEE